MDSSCGCRAGPLPESNVSQKIISTLLGSPAENVSGSLHDLYLPSGCMMSTSPLPLTGKGRNAPQYYSPQLDGLRFVAALLVFYHHSWALPGLGGLRAYGWIGVDLFLSISAFLLTRLLMLEFERWGNIGLSSFFVRRALRIWPLYFVFATFVCAIALVRQEIPLLAALGTWLSFVTFTHNILVALHGYSSIDFAAHLWTISLEEQAYLILPVFLLLTLRRSWTLGSFAWCCALLIGGLIGLRALLVAGGMPHPFIWVLPLRADSFLLGMLAAMLARPAGNVIALAVFALGSGVIASTALFPNINQPGLYQIFGYTSLAVGCALVVWAAQAAIFGRSWLGAAPARYLGKISYGIYVYHLICIEISHTIFLRVGLESSGAHFAASLLLTIAVSSVSYRFLERPFLLVKERFSKVSSRPV